MAPKTVIYSHGKGKPRAEFTKKGATNIMNGLQKIDFRVTGKARKTLAAAIGEIIGEPPFYAGAPRFEYVLGETQMTVQKDGAFFWDDNIDPALIVRILDGLEAQGYVFDRPEIALENPPENPDTVTIELPAMNVREDILRALIASRASLITAALGADGTGDLPIEFADGKVKFAWLRADADSDAVAAWSAFLAVACKFSKTAKRVTGKDNMPENPKFTFRTFLVKIGLKSAESKVHRKVLLRNLPGDSAFATPESKARWQAKHLKNHGTEVVKFETT